MAKHPTNGVFYAKGTLNKELIAAKSTSTPLEFDHMFSDKTINELEIKCIIRDKRDMDNIIDQLKLMSFRFK